VSVSVIRELYPSLLRKGDRGKFHDITNVPGQYGEQVRSDECRYLEDRFGLFYSSLVYEILKRHLKGILDTATFLKPCR
jgi:hypothetical protein